MKESECFDSSCASLASEEDSPGCVIKLDFKLWFLALSREESLSRFPSGRDSTSGEVEGLE